jgi:hypothetical protein
MSRTAVLFSPSSKPAPDVAISAAGLAVKIWLELKKAIFDPYRPERHYMRGAGPKSREKHVATSGAMRWDDRSPGGRTLPWHVWCRPMSSSNSPMRQPWVATN